jgi:hypothetical protein
MSPGIAAASWIAGGVIWLVAFVVLADDMGWLDTIAGSRTMRFLDARIGPVWRLIYKWTGAAALDRKLARRDALRDVAMFSDLAERLDGAGLGASADRCRDAATTAAARVDN